MAKKKDITRNPPSWIEKGLFIVVLLIIIGIAFPIFWKLNQATFEYYECVALQNELDACIDRWYNDHLEEWKAQGLSDKEISYKHISKDELEEYYGGEIPVCPHPSGNKAKSLFKTNTNSVKCDDHSRDTSLQDLPS